MTCRKRYPLRPCPGRFRTDVDGQRRSSKGSAARLPEHKNWHRAATEVMHNASGCRSSTRRRRDKSGDFRHDPDPQRRKQPLVGGGGDSELLHSLMSLTSTASLLMTDDYAPIRCTGLGRGTCVPQN